MQTTRLLLPHYERLNASRQVAFHALSWLCVAWPPAVAIKMFVVLACSCWKDVMIRKKRNAPTAGRSTCYNLNRQTLTITSWRMRQHRCWSWKFTSMSPGRTAIQMLQVFCVHYFFWLQTTVLWELSKAPNRQNEDGGSDCCRNCIDRLQLLKQRLELGIDMNVDNKMSIVYHKSLYGRATQPAVIVKDCLIVY